MRFSIIALAVLPAVLALPSAAPQAPNLSQCSAGTGPKCCNSVQDTNNPLTRTFLGLLGLNNIAQGILVGLQCNSIPIIGGVLGGTCSQQLVCCQSAQFNGLVNIGCTPISV